MLEAFFIQQVVPEFKSPHGFLRYRACDVVEKFESVDMSWQSKEVRLHLLFSPHRQQRTLTDSCAFSPT